MIAGTRLPDGQRVYASNSFLVDANALADLRVALVQVCIGGALLGAMLGFAVSLLLGRRLRGQVSLARRLAAGDLDARLNPTGSDEIAQLGRALDEMAEALSRKLGELDESAEREKRFSSDVAHELRTPVTGLVAAAALLDDSRAAGMVRERASALAALVEDLLEVMRLESGELPRLDPFDLARLVRDVVHLRLPGAEVDAPPELHVLCDPAARRAHRREPARQRPPARPAAGARARRRQRRRRAGRGARPRRRLRPVPAARRRAVRPGAARARRRHGSRARHLPRSGAHHRRHARPARRRGAVAQLRLPHAVTARPSTVQTALEIA